MIEWLMANKQWVFSGIGVAIIAGGMKLILSKFKKGKVMADNTTQSGANMVNNGSVRGDMVGGNKGDTLNIRAGGDVAVAKDHGKVIQIKDSQVGVVGDNANVNGGINFHGNRK